MPRARAAVASLLALGLTAGAREEPSLGVIRFPTSGPPPAQARFLRGVAALHSFAYEEALLEFAEAQRLAPGFAMAHWGEAMARNQTLWLNQDREGALDALRRLAPTPRARAQRAGSERERGFLAAVDVLYGEGDKAARDAGYARAMAELHERYPDDQEATTFYALALLATAHRSPALYSEANEETHQHALVGSATQAQVARLLEAVLRENPNHPGALHYAIHNYDDPEHARLALPAARAYAKAAPGSSHALHMPAHVFVQLGLWHEAAAADEASFAQSIAWTRGRGFGIGMRDYHSLSWLTYEVLQQGRYARARETLELIRPAVAETGAPRLKAIQSVMRAQYVVETRAWGVLREETSFSTSAELFAIGLSAAHTGLPAVAGQARQELQRRARSHKLDATVMEKEVGAILELRQGRPAAAVALAEEAVAAEKALPPPLGPPRPVKPSLELQGEVLMEAGRPREAALAFEQALARWPNRSASRLGLARARAALGDGAGARQAYAALLANWSRADAGIDGLEEARRAAGPR
jgi:tetratricopeptide (TPR) repeat protein